MSEDGRETTEPTAELPAEGPTTGDERPGGRAGEEAAESQAGADGAVGQARPERTDGPGSPGHMELPSEDGAEATASVPRAATPAVGSPRSNLGLMLDLELPVSVRFGRATMSLKTLIAVAPGCVLDMERSPEDPVEVLVDDHVVARAEVVVVGGNYGVRILDLASPADRVRALEA